jgi:hypothetical protein
MKIRIFENSIRLRVAPSEVDRLSKGEKIEASIRWGAAPLKNFCFSLEPGPTHIFFHEKPQPGIAITLDASKVSEWSQSDENALKHTFDNNAAHDALVISLEKDYACIGRGEEAHPDRFPNPQAGDKVC